MIIITKTFMSEFTFIIFQIIKKFVQIFILKKVIFILQQDRLYKFSDAHLKLLPDCSAQKEFISFRIFLSNTLSFLWFIVKHFMKVVQFVQYKIVIKII